MKLKYFFLLLCLLIPLTLFGEEVCPRPPGCPITEEGVCVGCIKLNEVETLIVSNSKELNISKFYQGLPKKFPFPFLRLLYLRIALLYYSFIDK